jgi:hypothetical protein|tara:strand:- start:29266 stop:29637 length:372 start_codon:yes stop_codon:yes gene_type:complete
MKRARTWLSFLLGLVVLVQGFAVAAAPRFMLGEDSAPQMASIGEMPCHANKATSSRVDDAPAESCCSADCPNMTTCMLGHMASVGLAEFNVPHLSRSELVVPPLLAISRLPNKLLRPPITLRG